MSQHSITVHLNDGQQNEHILADSIYAVEHSGSDNTFTANLRSLSELIHAPGDRRQLLLSQREPTADTSRQLTRPYSPTYDATLRFFDALLRMLHPFMPFITEELWQHLADRKEGESIMVECQAVEKPTEADARLCEEFETVKQVVAGVRSVRNQKNIAPRQQLVLQAVGTNEVAAYDAAILKMANLEKIEVVEAKAADASGFMVGKSEWAVPVGSLIDVEAELEKAKKELAHLEGFLTGVTKKLSNENFVAHAPAAVVEKERKKQADAMEKIAMVKAMIKALK